MLKGKTGNYASGSKDAIKQLNVGPTDQQAESCTQGKQIRGQTLTCELEIR